eukprot:335193-Rhodomonas_salina.6
MCIRDRCSILRYGSRRRLQTSYAVSVPDIAYQNRSQYYTSPRPYCEYYEYYEYCSTVPDIA